MWTRCQCPLCTYRTIIAPCLVQDHQGIVSIYKTVFPGMEIYIIKLRWLWDCLSFIMGIPILVRHNLYIEIDPNRHSIDYKGWYTFFFKVSFLISDYKNYMLLLKISNKILQNITTLRVLSKWHFGCWCPNSHCHLVFTRQNIPKEWW